MTPDWLMIGLTLLIGVALMWGLLYACGHHRHKWQYQGTHRRYCLGCGKIQYYVPEINNSGWEGSGTDPAHWEDLP